MSLNDPKRGDRLSATLDYPTMGEQMRSEDLLERFYNWTVYMWAEWVQVLGMNKVSCEVDRRLPDGRYVVWMDVAYVCIPSLLESQQYDPGRFYWVVERAELGPPGEFPNWGNDPDNVDPWSFC